MQIAERLHDRLFGVFIGFEIHFGDDKQFLTVNAAFEYPFAHRPFVAVGLRRVNHPITAFDCRGNRRVFNEESVNWMQGIICLKGCGASIEDIREYCRLCLLEQSEENLRARYAIILKQRKEAYKRLEEAEATVKYMDGKAAHYEEILAGLAPDDTNPNNRTAETRPRHETNKGAK